MITAVFLLLAIILMVLVAMPLMRSSHWSVRVFDYPRIQKLFLVLAMIGAWSAVLGSSRMVDLVTLALLALSAIYLAVVIRPYTPLGQRMVERTVTRTNEKPLTLMVCNVLQTNRDHTRLERLITQRRPDIVALLETNDRWRKSIHATVSGYPHRVEVPQENTYGMLLYSQLPLTHHEVNHLVDPEIPSIIADVEYAGQTVRLYVLHPTPPVPQENETSTDRDAEVLQVGRLAAAHSGACIVLGDLNDVAWSRTTELFLKTSKLMDPRRGRGFYNTFHAHYPFLRWPLDHFFVSSQFRLVAMRVEPTVGSDHFPISLSVVLRSDDPSEQLPIDKAEREEVSEKIAKGGL